MIYEEVSPKERYFAILPSMPTTKTRLFPVTLFTIMYMVLATITALSRGNIEFLFYIAVVIILGIIVLSIHTRARFSEGFLWALSIWGLLHMMGGLLELPAGWPAQGEHHVLYSLWLIPGYLKYDNPVHAYGFAVATLGCWQALKAGVPKEKPTLGVLTLCALAGMGLGSINEIVEFIAVLMIPGTNVGGFENTGWDMVANFVGSATAATMIRVSKHV